MKWNNYKTIEFHVKEGRFNLFLSGSHLRIQDMDKSLNFDRIVWYKMYKIDVTGFIDGYLIDLNQKVAYILSELKTLQETIDYIESKFLLQ